MEPPQTRDSLTRLLKSTGHLPRSPDGGATKADSESYDGRQTTYMLAQSRRKQRETEKVEFELENT